MSGPLEFGQSPNYFVIWRHQLGRYKGSYWIQAVFSRIPFWIYGVGSYKPSYHLENGEGLGARVNSHFLVKTPTFYKLGLGDAKHLASPDFFLIIISTMVLNFMLSLILVLC